MDEVILRNMSVHIDTVDLRETFRRHVTERKLSPRLTENFYAFLVSLKFNYKIHVCTKFNKLEQNFQFFARVLTARYKRN